MTRTEFERRFREAVSQATQHATATTEQEVAAPTMFVVHGAGHARRELSFDEAVEAPYISPRRNWVYIDVGVILRPDRLGYGWIGASGHEPQPDDRVYDGEGIGPFKPVGPIR